MTAFTQVSDRDKTGRDLREQAARDLGAVIRTPPTDRQRHWHRIIRNQASRAIRGALLGFSGAGLPEIRAQINMKNYRFSDERMLFILLQKSLYYMTMFPC